MSSFATTAFAVADASPAAPVFADAGHRASTKAPSGFGLGLGLPTDILHTSIAQSKSAPVGLGIYIPDFDFSEHGGVLVSAGTTIDDTATSALASSSFTSSEGMMGTRIPRRRMPLLPSPTFTDSDYAPMRTPSPSLLQAKFATPPVLFAFAAPNVPELDLIDSDSASDDGSEGSLREVAEASIEFGVLPTTESISSGLNLLCLSDEELMGYIPSGIVDADDDENYPMQAVGLGLSLAELDGPELVLTLHEHGFRDNNTHTLGSCINESLSNSASSTTTATTNSLLSSAFSSSSTFYNSLFSHDAYTHPSPHLLPHITSRYLVEGWMAHPKPRLAKVRIGFSLEDGAPVVDTTHKVNTETAEFASVNPPEEAYTLPTLGFESQEFWENYLDVLYGQY